MTTPRKVASSKRTTSDRRLQQGGSLQWVPLGETRVNPSSQREFVQAKADKILAKFDPEHFGQPVLNHRDGVYYIIDGQHRIDALKRWCGEGWEEQQFSGWVFEDLSESQEADAFLVRNDAMAVNAFNKFRIAVNAGREDETKVAWIVQNKGLVISLDRNADNSVSAVKTLLQIYLEFGPEVLSRTLEVIRDAYGKAGLEANVLRGLARVVARYGDDFRDDEAVLRLAKAYGGVGGVLNKAEKERKATNLPKIDCISAALVNAYNAGGRGQNLAGKSLKDWWREL